MADFYDSLFSDCLFSNWDRAARNYLYVRRDEPPSIGDALRRLALSSLDAPRHRVVGKRRAPILHPTKGYRGAHKHFRGGSR